MRKKGIKRDNEIFKCTLIANLSLRMSKLEREKKNIESEWQKDREKKGVMREERGKNKREERGREEGGTIWVYAGQIIGATAARRVLCTRRLLTSG